MARFENPLLKKVLRNEDEFAQSAPVDMSLKPLFIPPIHKPSTGPEPMLGTGPLQKGTKQYIVACRSKKNTAWHGLYAIKEKGRNRISQICEVPFLIRALIFDAITDAQAIEIAFIPSGRKDWVIQTWDKSSLVTGSLSSSCWKKLVRLGFNVSSSMLPKLQEYIRYAADVLPVENIIPTRKGLDRPGWFQGEYVTAGWRTKNAPVFIGSEDPESGAWTQSGDKKEYMETMRYLVSENFYFAMVAGYYLSGFLLSQFGGSENFILCLLGDSTLGKTLAAKFCIAMKGRPNVFATFDSTDGSLKAMMVKHNDGCMVIDEVGTSAMTDRQKSRFVYDVSSGKNRARLHRDGDRFNTEQSKAFKYSLLLTGEESLLVGPTAGGQRVRYTEIVFDRKSKPLWNSISSGQEADEYLRFFEKNHGFLAPAAIAHIQSHSADYVSAYREALESFSSEDDKASRKHKLFAGAYAGILLLCHCLCLAFDAEKYQTLLGDLVANAEREIIEHGEQQYTTVLSSTLLKFKDFFFTEINGDEETPFKQPVMGRYVIENDTHTLVLDKSQADYWAKKMNVDLARFLSWAEDSNILQTYPSKGRKYPKRYSRFKIGNGRVLCYKFNFLVEQQGTDSLDAPF